MSTTLVTAALVAGTASVQPGAETWLGVRYTIAPGWHIYWENPGDSGLATSVELRGAGVAVGALRWPGPRRLPGAGGLVSYGYEGTVTLLLPAQVEADAAGTLRIEGSTRWLVCKADQCIPGEAPLALALPVDAAGGGGTDQLAAARAGLPQPLPADAVTQVGAQQASLRLPGHTIQQLFPDRTLEGVLAGWEPASTADGPALRLRLHGAPPAGATAVIAATGPGGSTSWFTWPLSPPPSSPESP